MRDFVKECVEGYSIEVDEYDEEEGLQPPEEVILRRLAPSLSGRSILDLGVGAGRTTPHLLEISTDYVGVDITPDMVSRAARKFSSARLEVGDARNLRFGDSSFDLVFFSFNGLDHADHVDRLCMLREIHRVLKPGGWFVFSSHNREGREVRPSLRKLLQFRTVVKIPAYVARIVAKRIRRAQDRVRVENYDDYALIFDYSLGYPISFYTISLGSQYRQLETAGFHAIEAYDLKGAPIGMSVSPDWWLYYACRRN
jgi:ubiquinone/menaquinone biosynthesis C-methylase UbiE